MCWVYLEGTCGREANLTASHKIFIFAKQIFTKHCSFKAKQIDGAGSEIVATSGGDGEYFLGREPSGGGVQGWWYMCINVFGCICVIYVIYINAKVK